MKKYFFITLFFLHFNSLAGDFYEGYVQTGMRRFPIFVSKGLMTSSELARHFAGKNILYFERPILIIDRTTPENPLLYSAIPIDDKLLIIGTRSSDLQKLFKEKPSILTYHFNHQSLSVVLEDGQHLY